MKGQIMSIHSRGNYHGFIKYGTTIMTPGYPYPEHNDYNKSQVDVSGENFRKWKEGKVRDFTKSNNRLPSLRLYMGECQNGNYIPFIQSHIFLAFGSQ